MLDINIEGKAYNTYYSEGNTHIIGLLDRPFQAIKEGRKQIEVRTNTPRIPFDFNKISVGDLMKFINEATGEEILVKIIRIAHYPDVRTLLETEGTERTLSSGGNVEQGANSINSLTEYEEMINKNGVLAFEIKLV